MHFIITVDTEADNQWARPSGETIENIFQLPRFQALCDRYHLPPTYLITYEVARDPRAGDLLRSFQTVGAEIGSHLHPWTTPPFTDERDHERKIHRFPHELSNNELKAKLATLTEVVTKNFGQPVSYRSGRWGFDMTVAEELFEQGYLVDCSVTPKISWAKTLGDPLGSGGPDYRKALLGPYSYGRILEIPLTVIATGRLVREGGKLIQLYNLLPDSLLKKGLNKIFFKVKTLRIFPGTTSGDLEAIVAAAVRNKIPVIEFMIHSSELMAGSSKYSQTDADIERVYARLEELFSLISCQAIQGVTLKEYVTILQTNDLIQ